MRGPLVWPASLEPEGLVVPELFAGAMQLAPERELQPEAEQKVRLALEQELRVQAEPASGPGAMVELRVPLPLEQGQASLSLER